MSIQNATPTTPSRDFFFFPLRLRKKNYEGAANGDLPGPISRDLGSIQTLVEVTEKPRISSCLPSPHHSFTRHAVGTGGAGWEIRILFMQPAGLGHQSWQPSLCVCIPVNSQRHRSAWNANNVMPMLGDKGRELPMLREHCHLCQGWHQRPVAFLDVLCISLPIQSRGGGEEGEPALPARMRMQQGKREKSDFPGALDGCTAFALLLHWHKIRTIVKNNQDVPLVSLMMPHVLPKASLENQTLFFPLFFFHLQGCSSAPCNSRAANFSTGA